MPNTARDYSAELDAARTNSKQMPEAGLQRPGDFHVPQNIPQQGSADNYSDESSDDENNHAERLAKARGGIGRNVKDALNAAKNIAETATPVGAVSLLKQIDFISDMPYVSALGAALLKDLLDAIAGPTVILAIVFSILCSIFIFMMLLLAGSSGKRKSAKKFLRKILLLIGGGVADSIPGVDFFPIETLTVAVIYYLTLIERKNASKE